MWPNLQETSNLVTFTEEILKEKLHFFGSVMRGHEADTGHTLNDW